MAGIPARPSIAAAVEPARPPPMIAMSVYLMGDPAPRHQFCAGKGKQTLKERGIIAIEVFRYHNGSALLRPFVVDRSLLVASPGQARHRVANTISRGHMRWSAPPF